MKTTAITILFLILTYIGFGQLRNDTIHSGQTAIIQIGTEREILRYNDSGNDRYYSSNENYGVFGVNNYHLIPTTAPDDTVLTVLSTMVAGDGILFERGSVRRSITMSMNFDSIYIGCYGQGEMPIFKGAEIFTDFTPHQTRDNIWVTSSKINSLEAYRTVVVIDGDRFMPVSSLNLLDADLKYHIEDSTGTVGDSIYVWSEINPNSRITELSTKILGISDGIGVNIENTGITIRNLDFRYYGYYGIDFRCNNTGDTINGNILIENCNFYHNHHGAAQFYNGHNSNTINNCTASYNGNGFYSNIADNNTIKNCTISNTIEFTQGDYHPGFTDGHSIGMWNCDGVIVEDNYIAGDVTGGGIIGIDRGSGTIRYNKIDANDKSGIAIHRTNPDFNLDIYYNELFDSNGGVCIWADTVYATSEVNLYNNTIVGTSTGNAVIRFLYSDNVTFKNNIFYTNGSTYLINETYGDIVSDYNLWRAYSYYIWYGVGTHATTLTAWQAASGQDANSVDGDPLFTTDFTDFTLQTGSPAINAGVDLGFTRDILGNPIVGLPDIGAYEKQ